uniref:Putative secreted protein n=1 Tax=Ixodes ricinus TaxID=34613 RepID=A0A6B0UT90_IXORI
MQGTPPPRRVSALTLKLLLLLLFLQLGVALPLRRVVQARVRHWTGRVGTGAAPVGPVQGEAVPGKLATQVANDGSHLRLARRQPHTRRPSGSLLGGDLDERDDGGVVEDEELDVGGREDFFGEFAVPQGGHVILLSHKTR